MLGDALYIQPRIPSLNSPDNVNDQEDPHLNMHMAIVRIGGRTKYIAAVIFMRGSRGGSGGGGPDPPPPAFLQSQSPQ